MKLHVETPVVITAVIIATVAEVESGSTFRKSCLATKVQKFFTKPTMLDGAMPPETCSVFRSAVARKFQPKVFNV